MRKKKKIQGPLKCRLKQGDKVILLSGRDRKATGILKRILGNRMIVEGLNMVYKHVKANPQAGVEGSIIKKEATIHASNVAIYNPQTEKADRVGFKFLENGDKVRVFKSDQTHIDG
jgi:large subunit ribosomal protein L24